MSSGMASDRKLQMIVSYMRRVECKAILFDLDGVLVDSTGTNVFLGEHRTMLVEKERSAFISVYLRLISFNQIRLSSRIVFAPPDRIAATSS
jgi:hypothetical protein